MKCYNFQNIFRGLLFLYSLLVAFGSSINDLEVDFRTQVLSSQSSKSKYDAIVLINPCDIKVSVACRTELEIKRHNSKMFLIHRQLDARRVYLGKVFLCVLRPQTLPPVETPLKILLHQNFSQENQATRSNSCY